MQCGRYDHRPAGARVGEVWWVSYCTTIYVVSGARYTELCGLYLITNVVLTIENPYRLASSLVYHYLTYSVAIIFASLCTEQGSDITQVYNTLDIVYLSRKNV